MPLLLDKPIVKRIMLDLDTDLNPEQDTYVDIRQATQRQVEALASMNADTTRVLRGENQIAIESRFSYPEQQRSETFLTLSGSNIEVADVTKQEGKRDLFVFRKQDDVMVVSMSEEQFEAAWGLLPEAVAQAIHRAVLEVNPNWDPNLRKSSKQK